jgi:hypothetical protein
MRRSAIVTAAVIGAVATAAPATAVPKHAPQLGDWWCADTAAAPVATLELFKGNKYAVDGGDKAKYVYKVGQKKLKFKTGDLAGDHYGSYDKQTKTLTLHATADDAAWATCTQEEPVTEPTPEPLPEPAP